ncbi:unnamed protein product, partial [Didymodactylos carnosus]
MHLHQVLTGAANINDFSFAIGSIESLHFAAYAAGYNVVILSGDFQRVQVIPGSEHDNCLITCVDCTNETGKIIAAYNNQVCIYEPTPTVHNLSHRLNYQWIQTCKLSCCESSITALTWSPKGDQFIVVCDSTLQLWAYGNDEATESLKIPTNVQFGLDVELEQKLAPLAQKTWKDIWSYKLPTPIKHVVYSSDGTFFATIGQNDRLVRVWYRATPAIDRSFIYTYLAHPRPVISISWRKTSKFFSEGTLSNCLITCCKDNICRIWCETIKQEDSFMTDLSQVRVSQKRYHEVLDKGVQKLYKMRYNYFIPVPSLPNQPLHDLSSHTSVDQLNNDENTISATPVITNDDNNQPTPPFNISHSLSSFSSSSSSSIASIALPSSLSATQSLASNIVRFHVATTINPYTDILLSPNVLPHKDYPFIVQWLNNKDLFNTLSIERFVYDMQKMSKFRYDLDKSSNVGSVNTDVDDKNSNDTQTGSRRHPPIFGRTSIISDSKHFLGIRTKLQSVINDWITSPDVLFSIHPVDGSLLLWIVDWLDQPILSSSLSLPFKSIHMSSYPILHRQVQVSFSAKIPDVFPMGDALSLRPYLVLFCDHYPPPSLALSYDSTELVKRSSNNNSTNDREQLLPLVNMVTKHTNGTLNLWSLTFTNEQKFQSLVCVSHLARMCGHHFSIRHVVCHPIVPLVLTSSCYYSNDDEAISLKNKNYNSSLILWSTEPIGPMSKTGGITELARMESIYQNAYNLIAWFPMVIPSMATTILRDSPSFLFIASDGKKLRIYKVIWNAKALLTSQFGEPNSPSHINSSDNPRGNTTDQLKIASIQSTARPSCVVDLAEVTDSQCIWRNAKLIHIFPESAIDYSTQSPSSFRSKSITKKLYYLVLVEKVETKQSRIHMWEIIITYPADENESIIADITDDTRQEPNLITDVRSTKVSDYVLPVPTDAELQSVDVSFGDLSSSSLCYCDSSSSSPYLLTTIHSDGIVRFWNCTKQAALTSSHILYEWNEWCGILTYCEKSTRLSIIGLPLCVSNAYCGRLAVAFKSQNRINIGIYECESTGGTLWKHEEIINVNNDDDHSQKQLSKRFIHLDWASIENGSHLLAACIGHRILLFSAAYSSSKTTKTATLQRSTSISSLEDNTTNWIQFRTINLSYVDGKPAFPVRLKWVRGGLLFVGLDSELQVYSQWSSLDNKKMNQLKEQQNLLQPLIKTKQHKKQLKKALTATDLRKLSISDNDHSSSANNMLIQKQQPRQHQQKPQNKSPQTLSWLTLDTIDNLGLFNAARNAAPVLPQYHPKLLLELVRFGKYRRVKAILAHLTRCVIRSVHSVESKVEMKLMRTRTFSIANSENKPSGVTELEPAKYIEIDSIPLLPLFALFVADNETSSLTDDENNKTNGERDGDIDFDNYNDINKKYDDLFATAVHSEVEFKFDEENDNERKYRKELDKLKKEILSNRNWSASSLCIFDKRMVDLLVDYFQRIRLTSLTGTDQMYLLALADTLATVGNENATRNEYAMDDCGLRFLIDVKRYIYLSKILSPSQRSTLFKHTITSASFAWAFHSDLQEDLLALLPSIEKGKPDWNELKLFGVGWWIRNRSVITRLFEKLGKTAFEQNNDPLDGALYFLALKKKSFLYNLYKHVQDTKMQEFFKNDFTEDRWLKAAQKNAFALLGKQRFEHAAAFFLLGGKVHDAIEVCINNLHDIQLALLIARLYENEQPSSSFVDYLLKTQITTSPDPFVRSMAHWLLKDYDQSLTTLLQQPNLESITKYNSIYPVPFDYDTVKQSIFIFYDYLRQHPLILRAKQLATATIDEHDTTRFAIERRLHFQTAYHYINEGCPLLALEILAKLSPFIESESTTTTTATVISNNERTNGIETNGDSMDWSKPVTENKDDDELKLDWDDDENENEEKVEEKQVLKEEKIITEKNTSSFQQFDKVGQYIKLICCLKIVVEEMATLATGFEVVGGQLRHHLYCWLEQEIKIIRQLCGMGLNRDGENSGGGDGLSEVLNEPILFDMGMNDDNTENGQIPYQSSTPSSLIRTSHLETKFKRIIRRRQWLKSNEHLLRTLVSFTTLHGMQGGGLASVRMELLLLMQELTCQTRTQLKYPIPYPTNVPLLTANLSFSLSVSNNSIGYVRDVTYDILRTMNDWPTLPTLHENAYRIVALRDLAIALSSSIYQSLCSTNENQTTERLAVESFLRSYLYRRDSIRFHRRKSVTSLIEHDSPTTAPKDWPGIKMFISMIKEQDNDTPKLKTLLVEILVSVYMSLLIYALSTDDCSTLYRLIVRKWSLPELAIKLWYGVFGGGAKRQLTPSPNPIIFEKIQMFIPPRASIVNYFMAKISSEVKNYNYDSDNEDEIDDGEDEEDANDEEKTENSSKKIQSREHSDSMSYSWILMRFAIVRLVEQRLWLFFPNIGIEHQEIPILSPLLQQFLQNLNQWQESLRRTLDAFDSPPDNYLPLSTIDSTSDDYRIMLEPDNTPFSESLSALPVKRLWNYLVNEEQLQNIFIKYIFKRKSAVSTSITSVDKYNGRLTDSSITDSGLPAGKIIYRASESISSFCLNNLSPSLIAVGLLKEIIELDISNLTTTTSSFRLTEFADDDNEIPLTPTTPLTLMTTDPTSRARSLRMSAGIYLPNSYLTQPTAGANGNNGNSAEQLICRHAIRDTVRFANHPILPHYLCGCNDGSVYLMNWNQDSQPRQVRESTKRVTKLDLNCEGNKFGIADADGYLSLHVLTNNRSSAYM